MRCEPSKDGNRHLVTMLRAALAPTVLVVINSDSHSTSSTSGVPRETRNLYIYTLIVIVSFAGPSTCFTMQKMDCVQFVKPLAGSYKTRQQHYVGPLDLIRHSPINYRLFSVDIAFYELETGLETTPPRSNPLRREFVIVITMTTFRYARMH